MVLEIIVNNFIWTFDFSHSLSILQVIWVIGLCMVCLSFLIYLPKKIILLLGILLVAGHNLLDGIITEGTSFSSIIWYILHQDKFLVLSDTSLIVFHYPAIPWIGLIALGYCFGTWYQKDFDAVIRKKWLLGIGLGAIVLFFLSSVHISFSASLSIPAFNCSSVW